jgi:hypothetical protein
MEDTTLSCGYEHPGVYVTFHKVKTTANYEVYESDEPGTIGFKIHVDKDVAQESGFGDKVRILVERDNP